MNGILLFFATAAGLCIVACRTVPGQDVRYEPAPMRVVRAMLELADVGPADVVYDLGSGDGRIPITAASEFGARGVGIEIDARLVKRAHANARKAGVADRVEFRVGDMYGADIHPATVVAMFLHPGPNLKLRPRLRAELRPGARIVSYMWNLGDWTPDEVRRINRSRIFLWRIPSDLTLWSVAPDPDPTLDCVEHPRAFVAQALGGLPAGTSDLCGTYSRALKAQLRRAPLFS